MLNISVSNASKPLSLKSEIDFYDNRFLMFVLDGMAYEYEKRFDDVIRLTLGKSELPVCESITQAMVDALKTLEKSTLVFPAGVPALKERIAEEYLQRYSVEINPDNVIISVGTSAAFRNLFYLLACKNDEVLLPLPYYPLYQFSAFLAGAAIRYYNIDLQTMAIDLESFEDNFTEKTKIVVINSPGNPLGNIISKDEIHAIDDIVEEKPQLSVMRFITTRISMGSLFLLYNLLAINPHVLSRMLFRKRTACIAGELVTPLSQMNSSHR